MWDSPHSSVSALDGLEADCSLVCAARQEAWCAFTHPLVLSPPLSLSDPPPPWLFQTIGSSCELVKTLWNVAKEAAWPANGFNRASGNAPQKLLVWRIQDEMWNLKRCRNSAAATTHEQRFNLSQRLQWQIDASWERHTSRFHSITLNTRCISDLQSCRKCFKHDSLTSKQIFKVYVLSSLEYLDF